jgi:hypothetical protein
MTALAPQWDGGDTAIMASDLPPFFPAIGPVTRAVLLHDFAATGPTRPEDWEAEAEFLAGHRLAATALRHAREVGVDLPVAVVATLQTSSFEWSVQTQQAIVRSVGALDALRGAGIAFVVTKGPGIAAAYSRRAERPFSDLDVVVRPADFERAHCVLTARGMVEEDKNLPPWPFFNRRCREGVNLRSLDGASVDLHHHIPPWYWTSHLGVEGLIAAARPLEIMGVEIPCASPSHNLVVAGLHIVSDRGRPGQSLIVWRDLLALAAVCDPDDAAAAAAQARLAGWLHWVLLSLPAQARPEPLLQALAAHDQPIAGRRRAELLLPPRLGSRHLVGQALRLPLANGVLFLGGTAVPSRQFVNAKAGGYRRWWRDVVVGLGEARRVAAPLGPAARPARPARPARTVRSRTGSRP